MSLSRAIRHLYPDAEFVLVGDDYELLTWEGPGEKPSEAELRAAEAAADVTAANKVQEQRRAAAFREESDPLFFSWQRSEGTEQDWLNKVAEVRARHPYEV